MERRGKEGGGRLNLTSLQTEPAFVQKRHLGGSASVSQHTHPLQVVRVLPKLAEIFLYPGFAYFA